MYCENTTSHVFKLSTVKKDDEVVDAIVKKQHKKPTAIQNAFACIILKLVGLGVVVREIIRGIWLQLGHR